MLRAKKGSAKGFNFKEDDRALPLEVITLLYTVRASTGCTPNQCT